MARKIHPFFCVNCVIPDVSTTWYYYQKRRDWCANGIFYFVVYPLLFSALFRAGGEGAGIFALILFVVLLVTVYFTYQIIETALFEIFMINLPF